MGGADLQAPSTAGRSSHALSGYVSDTAVTLEGGRFRSAPGSGSGSGRSARRWPKAPGSAAASNRKAVVAVLDASAQTLILSLDTGQPLGSGSWTTVRHASPGVAMHLLASDGSPLAAPSAPQYVIDRQGDRLRAQLARLQEDRQAERDEVALGETTGGIM